MGRLIDADALIEELKMQCSDCMDCKERSIGGIVKGAINDCIKIIAKQHTAYKMDKVVEELACNSRFIDDINEHNVKCVSCVIGQKTEIEIVRKGGVEHG